MRACIGRASAAAAVGEVKVHLMVAAAEGWPPSTRSAGQIGDLPKLGAGAEPAGVGGEPAEVVQRSTQIAEWAGSTDAQTGPQRSRIE